MRAYADPQVRDKLHAEAVERSVPIQGAIGLSKTWWDYMWVNEPALEKNRDLQFKTIGEIAKLQKSIGGVKDMGGIPDAIFVVDVGYHKIAVTEANKLGVPVIAVVDTNHSPEGIDYVIPGNDDASKAVALYAQGVADAILEGRANAVNDVVQAVRGDDGDEFVEVSPEA